jgi:HTH-type transcriptional regulator / antitoxin HigA
MNARIPAEVFPPGEFLRDELEARDWTQQQLAEIMGRPPRVISEIMQAKRAITPETAIGLASALGTSAEFWMNLESQYALSKVRVGSDEVIKRAQLHNRFPVREMQRRNWLPQSLAIADLERHVTGFFEEFASNDGTDFAFAAKKASHAEPPTVLQLAWLVRCRQMARRQVVSAYSEPKLQAALQALHGYLIAPEEARHVPRLLRESGISFVMVEALPSSKIDGACFWLSKRQPVIAMSLRFDRIDNFWFVLRHEIEHVLRGDGKEKPLGIVDQDIGEGGPADRDPAEVAADHAAATWTVPPGELDDFIARVNPFFSEAKILGFASRLGVHPGIVVGQLQRRINRHDLLRRHQVKIRNIVASAGDVDGWGSVPNVSGETS